MGLHFGGHTTANRGLAVTNRGELHYTGVRHAGDTPREGFVWCKTPTATNLKCAISLQDLGAASVGAKKFARHHPSTGSSAKNSPSKRKNAEFGPI